MMMHLPYGWRGRIGLIYIASAYSMETEFHEMAPTGVTTHTTRVALSDDPNHFTIEDLQGLEDKVIEAAKLLSQAPLKSIAYGCTSGSFVNGLKYDKQFIKQLEKLINLPVTTTAYSVLQAMKALEIHKVAIATPYSNEVNERAYDYFTSGGLTITNLIGLGIMNDYKISSLSPETVYNLATRAMTSDADALFISCTGLSTLPLIKILEQDLQVPVITSNQATFWHTLKIANIHSNLTQYGSLFQR